VPCALSHALLVRVATLAFGYFHSTTQYLKVLDIVLFIMCCGRLWPRAKNAS
jgi:hypothetical protein